MWLDDPRLDFVNYSSYPPAWRVWLYKHQKKLAVGAGILALVALTVMLTLALA